MKFKSAPAFARDFKRLPREHQEIFRNVVRQQFLPAIAAGSLSGDPPWPPKLRIHRLHGSAVYSLTWSFTGPDGRATFHVETDERGDPRLVWRRIGSHSIYQDP